MRKAPLLAAAAAVLAAVLPAASQTKTVVWTAPCHMKYSDGGKFEPSFYLGNDFGALQPYHCDYIRVTAGFTPEKFNALKRPQQEDVLGRHLLESQLAWGEFAKARRLALNETVPAKLKDEPPQRQAVVLREWRQKIEVMGKEGPQAFVPPEEEYKDFYHRELRDRWRQLDAAIVEADKQLTAKQKESVRKAAVKFDSGKEGAFGLKSGAERLAQGGSGAAVFDGAREGAKDRDPSQGRLAAHVAGGAASGAVLGRGDALVDKTRQRYNPDAVQVDSESQRSLKKRLSSDPKVKKFYEGLDADERAEFDRVYEKYHAQVNRRKGEGWSSGWMGNVGVNVSDSEAGDRPPKYETDKRARNIEEDVLPRLRAGLAEVPNDGSERSKRRRDAYQHAISFNEKYLGDLKTLQSKKYGLCHQWATDNKTMLQDQDLQHWRADTITRSKLPEKTDDWPVVGGWSQHTALELCSQKDRRKCVVLDAWPRARPDLVSREEWVGSNYLR